MADPSFPDYRSLYLQAEERRCQEAEGRRQEAEGRRQEAERRRQAEEREKREAEGRRQAEEREKREAEGRRQAEEREKREAEGRRQAEDTQSTDHFHGAHSALPCPSLPIAESRFTISLNNRENTSSHRKILPDSIGTLDRLPKTALRGLQVRLSISSAGAGRGTTSIFVCG